MNAYYADPAHWCLTRITSKARITPHRPWSSSQRRDKEIRRRQREPHLSTHIAGLATIAGSCRGLAGREEKTKRTHTNEN